MRAQKKVTKQRAYTILVDKNGSFELDISSGENCFFISIRQQAIFRYNVCKPFRVFSVSLLRFDDIRSRTERFQSDRATAIRDVYEMS